MLRTGQVAAVHPTRVACRRYRSTLRTFRPTLPGHRVERLEGELRWWAAELGGLRDREVLGRTLDESLVELPDSPASARLAALARAVLDSEMAAQLQRVQALLGSPRYAAMLVEASAVASSGLAVGDPVARLHAARRRVERRLAEAAGSQDPEHLHEVRKAAKRARYAAEALAPVIGAEPSGRDQQLFERVQDLLGHYQDLVVAERFVAGLAPSDQVTPDQLVMLSGRLRARTAAAKATAWTHARESGLVSSPPSG